MIVNLGCPRYCAGMVCVDRRPLDSRVVGMDVRTFLYSKLPETYDVVRSKNLLEHLADPGSFLVMCNQALVRGGRIVIITDNAEWLPFYLPFYVMHTGLGAHNRNRYAIEFCESPHYSVFTVMHLRNLLERAGFKQVETRRDRKTLGARIVGTGIKPLD